MLVTLGTQRLNLEENTSQTFVYIYMYLEYLVAQTSLIRMFSGLGRLNLKGFYVEWNDITDVWLYWDDMKSRIIRNVGERIGFSSGMIITTVLLKLLKTALTNNWLLPFIS